MVKATDVWTDLEVFTEKGARFGNSTVTVTSNRAFVLSSGFVHEAKLKKYSHVVLAYSAKRKAIVFDFTSDNQARGAHKLVIRGSAYVGCRAFFKFYSLNAAEWEGKYRPQKEKFPQIGDAWVIYQREKTEPQ